MVNLYEAKTNLSRLVAAVESKEDRIVLCRNGVPVADIVPHANFSSQPLKPDARLKGARFLDDPTAPLSPKDWPAECR